MKEVLGELSKKGYVIFDDVFHYLFVSEIDFNSDLMNWTYSNSSNHIGFPSSEKNATKFWGSMLYEVGDKNSVFNECPKQVYTIYEFFCKIIFKEEIFLKMIQTNGQTIYQDGNIHRDDHVSPLTLMYFVNSNWEPSWGGEFQIMESQDNNSKVKVNIEFKPGRVVLFDATLPHRGLAPSVPNVFRKTIAFRLGKLN
jgi:hypothetical protein